MYLGSKGDRAQTGGTINKSSQVESAAQKPRKQEDIKEGDGVVREGFLEEVTFVLQPAKGRFRRGAVPDGRDSRGKDPGARVGLVYWRNGGQCGCRRVEWCEASRAPAGLREEFRCLLRFMGNPCSARHTVGTRLSQLAAVIVRR